MTTQPQADATVLLNVKFAILLTDSTWYTKTVQLEWDYLDWQINADVYWPIEHKARLQLVNTPGMYKALLLSVEVMSHEQN